MVPNRLASSEQSFAFLITHFLFFLFFFMSRAAHFRQFSIEDSGVKSALAKRVPRLVTQKQTVRRLSITTYWIKNVEMGHFRSNISFPRFCGPPRIISIFQS